MFSRAPNLSPKILKGTAGNILSTRGGHPLAAPILCCAWRIGAARISRMRCSTWGCPHAWPQGSWSTTRSLPAVCRLKNVVLYVKYCLNNNHSLLLLYIYIHIYIYVYSKEMEFWSFVKRKLQEKNSSLTCHLLNSQCISQLKACRMSTYWISPRAAMMTSPKLPSNEALMRFSFFGGLTWLNSHSSHSYGSKSSCLTLFVTCWHCN